MKTFKEAQDYIYSFINYEKTPPVSKNGEDTFNLDGFYKFLDALGNPHREIKFVHIAGTKGKGTTAAFLSNILSASGYKTGLFTSPHIKSIKERYKINNREISDRDFVKYVNILKDTIDKGTFRNDGFYRTAFELMTALAFLYFLDKKVDVAVIETGLGGRLDCTNVVNPLLSVITTIDFDHTHLLGNTIEKIASEKGGIIKRDTPVYVGKQFHNEGLILKTLSEIAKEKNAPFYNLEEIASLEKRNVEVDFQSVSAKIFGEDFDFDIKLNGLHQVYNGLNGIICAELLNKCGLKTNKNSIIKGLLNTTIAGRIEIIRENDKTFIIDAAHCPISAEYLNKTIGEIFPDKKRIFLINMMSDKDIDNFLKYLINKDRDDIIIIFEGNNFRSAKTDVIKNFADKYCNEVYTSSNLHDALNKAVNFDDKENRLIILTGSFYYIQDFKEILQGGF